MNIPIDTAAQKDAMRAQWDAAATGWNAHTSIISTWLTSATDAMCRMANVRPGARVLDVAAGAGDQTATLAERVGPISQKVLTQNLRMLEREGFLTRRLYPQVPPRVEHDVLVHLIMII